MLHFASGDSWGGAERALTLMVEGILRFPGLQVEVLLSNDGALASSLRELGVIVTVLPEAGRSRLEHARAVHAWLRSRRFDVLHVHRYKEIALAALVPAHARGRLVVTVHGLEPLSRLGLRTALTTWAPLLAARARHARFAAVSRELEARLARVLGRGSVCHVPNPVRATAAAPAPSLRGALGWAPDRPLVAFVGRLEPVKGPDQLVSIAAAGDGVPGFALIGAGNMEAELRRRVEEEGLGDRVAFVGEVPDAMACIAQADVLALTSRHEGMPMVLLEAALCGVPVVAYDVGGVAEVLDGGPAARRIPPGDAAAFRAALDETLRGRAQIDAALRGWAEGVRARFSLEATASAYLRLYRGDDLARATEVPIPSSGVGDSLPPRS